MERGREICILFSVEKDVRNNPSMNQGYTAHHIHHADGLFSIMTT
jgi:hypothetical protein